MTFPENLILEDERVLMRPLQADDIRFFLPFAITEQDLWKYSPISASGENGMKSYIQTTLGQRLAQIEYPFIIFDKLTDECAGCTRFYDIQLNNKSVQIGYTWYGKKFQRTGLNRHCKLLLLTYAFEKWQMERVGFGADTRNLRSIEAMKAIGCIPEGIIRSTGPSAMGGRRDSIVLSILRQEWLNGGKEKLENLIRPTYSKK